MFGRMPKIPEQYRSLIENIAHEDWRPYGHKLKDTPGGRQLLALSREEQRDFVLAVVHWLDHVVTKPPDDYAVWRVRFAMQTIMNRSLPFEAEQVMTLLDWSMRQSNPYWSSVPQVSVPQVIGLIENYLRDHSLTPELSLRIDQLIKHLQSGYSTTEKRKWIVRLQALTGVTNTRLPLAEGEAWSDAAIADIRSLPAAQQQAWIELLSLCQKASGSAPSGKWIKSTEPLLKVIGFAAFKQAIIKWFPLVDKPRTRPITSLPRYGPDPNLTILMIQGMNADLLKALAWLCGQYGDRELARAITALALSAYRKLPGVGPRCARVGNACVLALGNMPGTEGIAQLALLKVKLKIGSVQKAIEKALASAAERSGLPQDEIEEMSVPTYGLQEVGARHEPLGEYTIEIMVTGTDAVNMRWLKPDGKPQTSVPQAVKQQYAGKLEEIKQAVKDIQKMLPAQRDRIDSLFLQQKKWDLHTWRAYYLDHPLVGTLARRIIWKFTSGDHATSGIWYDGQLVDRNSEVIDWLNDSTQVELWHPIQASTEIVLEWRNWLLEHEVRQPFKQAHREIYLLTDAERTTRVYSNRYAAHIIRQHQFNALCVARGWKNKLRLMVDDEYPPARRFLHAWGLRAEFWIEGAGTEYGTDTNPTGTYLYLATDQVRFYAIDTPEHSAHAYGGGYHAGRFGDNALFEPLELENIPPLVFSEIMRDVDLFVGVASVGNDPAWFDGGPQGRYQDYWSRYSFGDLSQTAQTRKQVLEQLIPRLKIADRCQLLDRFLVVRGDLRTYKIHLGSGNILMEPNDQYLCIVPARGVNDAGTTGRVFLPFEGDQTFAVILSKAFLLADDKKIKDPTIIRQIRR